MGHRAGIVIEECGGPHALGTVDDLIGEHKIAGANLLTQGANRGEGDDSFDSKGFERGDVGASGDGGRRVRAVCAVAGEEGEVYTGEEPRDCDGGAGKPPGLLRVGRLAC